MSDEKRRRLEELMAATPVRYLLAQDSGDKAPYALLRAHGPDVYQWENEGGWIPAPWFFDIALRFKPGAHEISEDEATQAKDLPLLVQYSPEDLEVLHTSARRPRDS